MASTRKVTITIDDGLFTDVQAFMQETGETNLSGLVGKALREHVTRRSIERVREWRAGNGFAGDAEEQQWAALVNSASRELDTLRGADPSSRKGPHAA